MEVSLRMVLTAQGMFSQPVGGNILVIAHIVNTRIDCAHLCLQDRTCSAFFYDDLWRCQLSDALQSVTSMKSDLPSLQYYEIHSDYCNNNGFTFIRGLNLCYKVYSNLLTWHQARDHCLYDGGHLIRIQTEMVNNLMLTLAKHAGTSLWTDGSRFDDTYRWQDNSNVTMSYWALGEPLGSPFTKCIVVKVNETMASSSWHGVDCNSLENSFVCQKDISNCYNSIVI